MIVLVYSQTYVVKQKNEHKSIAMTEIRAKSSNEWNSEGLGGFVETRLLVRVEKLGELNRSVGEK